MKPYSMVLIHYIMIPLVMEKKYIFCLPPTLSLTAGYKKNTFANEKKHAKNKP